MNEQAESLKRLFNCVDLLEQRDDENGKHWLRMDWVEERKLPIGPARYVEEYDV